MSATVHDLLEKHFETAFAAPDGIQKLRELILTLAMQGKLVEQDPNDPPASELLKEIEAEKQRLVQEGKIKKPKKLPPIEPEEVPYQLPQGWEWVRLGALTRYNIGKTPASKNPIYWSENDGHHWASISDMPIRGYLESTAKKITQKAISDVFKSEPVPAGSLLMSFKLSIGKTAITKVDTYHNEAIISFVHLNEQLKMYLYWILYEVANAGNTKGAIKGRTLNSESIRNLLIPLPPLPEQHRIVKRIDQLMARCDALEKLRKEREEKRLTVHAAAVKQLLDATSSFPRRRESSSSEELDPRFRGGDGKGRGSDGVSVSAWNFIHQHFGELYTVKENVTELRKAILQLAVMGRLVPQDPNDPPASELLKEIEAEKQRLIQEGKIKKPKKLPPIKPEEVPYELQQGWEWVRLGELGITQTGTTPPSKDRENYGGHVPFVGPGDIKNGRIDYSGEGLSKKGLAKGRLIDTNSVLMVCIGGSIGKHAINERDIACNQQINTLTPYSPIPVKYIYFVMASVYFQNEVLSRAGGSATPIINKQKWSGICAPLPPLPEQHRIVKRIDQLMALCDRLEQQIDAATGKQTELLGAVMAQV